MTEDEAFKYWEEVETIKCHHTYDGGDINHPYEEYWVCEAHQSPEAAFRAGYQAGFEAGQEAEASRAALEKAANNR